jgi:WD40 repeat protein
VKKSPCAYVLILLSFGIVSTLSASESKKRKLSPSSPSGDGREKKAKVQQASLAVPTFDPTQLLHADPWSLVSAYVANYTPSQPLTTDQWPVRDVRFAPHTTELAYLGDLSDVAIHDLPSKKEVRRMDASPDRLYSLDYHPNRPLFVTAGLHGMRVYNPETCLLKDEETYGIPIMTTKFSPDGQLLASGGFSHTVIISDLVTGEVIGLPGQKNYIDDLVWLDRNRIATAGKHAITICDWRAGAKIHQFAINGPGRWNHLIDVSDGIKLVSVTQQGLGITDLKMNRTVHTIPSAQSVFTSVAVSHGDDPTIIATTEGRNEPVLIYDLASATLIDQLPNNQGRLNAITFSPQDNFIAAANNDGTVVLWEQQNVLKQLKEFYAPKPQSAD